MGRHEHLLELRVNAARATLERRCDLVQHVAKALDRLGLVRLLLLHPIPPEHALGHLAVHIHVLQRGRRTILEQRPNALIETPAAALIEQLLHADGGILGQDRRSAAVLGRHLPQAIPLLALGEHVKRCVCVAELQEPVRVLGVDEERLVRLLDSVLEGALPLCELPRLLPALALHCALDGGLELLCLPQNFGGGLVAAHLAQPARDFHDHLGVSRAQFGARDPDGALPDLLELVRRQRVLPRVEVRVHGVRPLLGIFPHAPCGQKVGLRATGAA
mmetsp:Transcript_38025/g.65637  ORF Transcript_38025/g.65637 Transcript_38025/m.65637 type:complete len:275 (+) Transcript_38025:663-1487(+)